MTSVIGAVALQPSPAIPGWSVRAELYGDRDLLDEPLTLGEGDDVRDVRIIFTDAVADFSGTVVRADTRAAPGCTVAIFPQRGEPSFESRRTRLQRSDQNGRFRFADLPSGSYLTAAIGDVDAAVWMTPDYLARLRTFAVPITLDRERQTTMLSCVDLP